MKVTKLKKGYRINLSDTEMSLLRQINGEGIQAFYELHPVNQTGLNSAQKRILTEIQTMKREWL
jgi:hypothetical protein